MKKFAALAVMPLFACFLSAQDTRTTETQTTKTTTYNGTLVDAGCRTTHTEHSESSSNPSEGTSSSRSEKSDKVDCPVTTSTSSFGLMTSDGKFVRFDDPGNTKVVEMMKSNKDWSRSINEHQPVRVRVIGTPNGDTVVVQEIR
jgi:hypothetical protein